MSSQGTFEEYQRGRKDLLPFFCTSHGQLKVYSRGVLAVKKVNALPISLRLFISVIKFRTTLLQIPLYHLCFPVAEV